MTCKLANFRPIISHLYAPRENQIQCTFTESVLHTFLLLYVSYYRTLAFKFLVLPKGSFSLYATYERLLQSAGAAFGAELSRAGLKALFLG